MNPRNFGNQQIWKELDIIEITKNRHSYWDNWVSNIEQIDDRITNKQNRERLRKRCSECATPEVAET